MKLKLVRKQKSTAKALVPVAKDKQLTMADIKLPREVIEASMSLAVPPAFIVECWLANRCSRRMFDYICSNTKLFNALKAIEENPTVYEIVMASRMYTLTATERRAVENAALNEYILKREDELIDNLFTLAKGYELETTDKKGDRIYIDVGPSLEANKYLLDRALGKPTQAVEGEGAGKPAVQNVIILPSNGRGDEPQATTRQLESVTDVPFLEK